MEARKESGVPHCPTCHCETDYQRRMRHKREQEQREREFVRNRSVLTDDDVAWMRARLGGADLGSLRKKS